MTLPATTPAPRSLSEWRRCAWRTLIDGRCPEPALDPLAGDPRKWLCLGHLMQPDSMRRFREQVDGQAPLSDSPPRPRLTAPPTPADIDELGTCEDAVALAECEWLRP